MSLTAQEVKNIICPDGKSQLIGSGQRLALTRKITSGLFCYTCYR